jgi:hypothetical protein
MHYPSNYQSGSDSSSANAGKRAALSHIRSLLAPAIVADEYVVIRWRDASGAMRRERVVPVEWQGRTKVVTACDKVIDLDKIEEVVR